MTVLVCGLSRSGKTSLLQRMDGRILDYSYISASAILKDSGMRTVNISVRDAVLNQDVITDHLVEKHPEKFIIDGHILLETIDGPFLVPESSINKWKLSGIIFVTESASLITARRTASNRIISEREIESLIHIEMLYARYISGKLRIKFAEIKTPDTLDIREFLEGI